MDKIKRRFISVLTIAGACFIIAVALYACKKTADSPVEETGKIYIHPSGVNILTLKGSYFEMGKQYGTLMKDDLHKWAKYYDSTWKSDNPHVYNFITKLVFEQGNKLFLSPKIKDFLEGEVAASGLSKSDVYLLDMCLSFDYMFSSKIPLKSRAGCTFVGAYGAATEGHTIVGRNLDLQRPLAVRDYNCVITIMHPTNGDHSVATFGFVGFPQGYALLNLDNMVFTEYNTGNSADSWTDPLLESKTMMDLAFDAITDKTNTDAPTTAEYLKNKPLLSPTFFGVADQNGVWVVQRPISAPGIITTNSLGNGINGVTNVFLDSLINGVKLTIYNSDSSANGFINKKDTPGRGMVRWVHIVNYFSTHPGPVDINSIKTIVSTNIADGGAFITGYEIEGTNSYCQQDATFGSVVVDLSDLTNLWWLRYDYATKNKKWDNINLTQYLN
ncbi:MAG: hypothetical protein WCI71_17035 [Bacteroidota bacterium]